MTSRACSTEYRLKHPCGKAAGVLCRICTVLVLLCRGGRRCPPCMTTPYHFVGDGVPTSRIVGGDAHIVPPMSFRASAHTGVGIRLSSPPSEREVSARSADGGRDATRFSLPQSAAPTAPSQRGPISAAARQSAPTSSVKIIKIPNQILCTYPKCENFAGNGCGWSLKVLYLTHTS